MLGGAVGIATWGITGTVAMGEWQAALSGFGFLFVLLPILGGIARAFVGFDYGVCATILLKRREANQSPLP
jgi:hypothetical protein